MESFKHFLKLNFDNPSNHCGASDFILTKKDIPVGFIEVRSKALALKYNYNMESRSVPFRNDEVGRFAKHRVTQILYAMRN